MAEALALSRHAPLQIVSALACDQPEVASVVLARSPLLTDADLIERVASGQKAIQMLIADRPAVSMELSAAIAEIGEAEACRALVANEGAEIAPLSFRRMAERHGHVGAAARGADRRPAAAGRLPPHAAGEARRCAEGLAAGRRVDGAFARRTPAQGRLRESLADADRRHERRRPCRADRASAGCAAISPRASSSARLRMARSTSSARCWSRWPDQSEQRVRSLLAAGSDVALSAVLRSAGLSDAIHGILIRALKVWREVANGKRVAGAQEVSWLMLKELGGQEARRRSRRAAQIHPSRRAARKRARTCAGDRCGLRRSCLPDQGASRRQLGQEYPGEEDREGHFRPSRARRTSDADIRRVPSVHRITAQAKVKPKPVMRQASAAETRQRIDDQPACGEEDVGGDCADPDHGRFAERAGSSPCRARLPAVIADGDHVAEKMSAADPARHDDADACEADEAPSPIVRDRSDGRAGTAHSSAAAISGTLA